VVLAQHSLLASVAVLVLVQLLGLGLPYSPALVVAQVRQLYLVLGPMLLLDLP
jgi:hypothetical protein